MHFKINRSNRSNKNAFKTKKIEAIVTIEAIKVHFKINRSNKNAF